MALPYLDELRELIKEFRRFNDNIEKHGVTIDVVGKLIKQVDVKKLLSLFMSGMFHHRGTEDAEPKDK